MLSLALALVLVGSPELQWLGSTHSDAAATLHTAARRYAQPGQPDVWLVGVAHLGDSSYYEAIDDLLQSSDTVIYEAVMPEGAQAPGGIDDASKASSTRASLHVIASMAAGHSVDSIEALAGELVDGHRPSANVVQALRNDGWGNRVEFSMLDGKPALRSLGADGRPGGDGPAADIIVAVPEDSGADGSTLQRALAEALRMRFQLNSLPYEQAHWVPGDMTAEELHRRLTGTEPATPGVQGEEDGEPFELAGMLTGTSFSGQFAVGMIRMLPALDALSGGRAIDGLRMLLIESLSNPELLKQGTAMLGERFEQVILHDRNDVAVAFTLKHCRRHGPGDAVAVLYGAAHMPGIDALMRTEGWVPVETRWLNAMQVDLLASKLTSEDIDAIRNWSEMAGSLLGR